MTIPYMPQLCCVRCDSEESGCLGFQLKVGGKFHLRLNIGNRPIANKYCEGKMKRTLKRELKGLEIAKREPFGTSVAAVYFTGTLSVGFVGDLPVSIG